ncbi:uncharacterized protein PFL1_02671 [Pseudozyma flocculosa PF-1]|uniref:Dynactin subunit 5 n=2 Tax=Pseudozyma flocculosa TaxID=84751 RepID=A0A5C3F1H8_9BASI|nr:uncharacterized protein PFL1_02671 [Pseudozyma flocculosa PF-1]EPQ29998.1 hypothetical protein PFL1_02671 [Pseudozyma flocculosa PF-1]SPO37319.1 probable dynactin Arp1 p25 subunit RO12 [Pseudozyma flocculosa]
MAPHSKPMHYNPSEYIQTALTGNHVSKRSVILGSANIILGGKCILHQGAVIRGDLKRSLPSSSSSAPSSSATSASGPGAEATPRERAPQQTIVVMIGRYCLLDEGCVIRPPYKTYRGQFSYYPLKMGDHVSIGANSVVEAAALGSHVEVGANCVIGRFVMIKDCVRILDNSVVAPNTVIPPYSIYGGSPAKLVGELPEMFLESCEAKRKDYYQRFKPATDHR